MPVSAWASDSFHSEVREWVHTRAEECGVRLTGEMQQPHNRPWSSTIRFSTDSGDLWFKVNGPGTRHEGALVQALSQLEPDLVPGVLAVDPERGWWLMRDAGPLMRNAGPAEALWDAWRAILARYAAAQVRLASHREALRATAVPVVSAATLPGRFESLVVELAARPPDEGGLEPGEAAGLRALLPAYHDLCAELAASDIPDTIQHDDLHSANVCWPGSAEGARIIDWGDASLGHPFGTMLSTLNSIAYHAGCEVDDPRVATVRDAFLAPFEAFAPHRRLVELVGIARRVGCVTRALSWARAFEGEPRSVQADEDFPVRGWLLELLESR